MTLGAKPSPGAKPCHRGGEGHGRQTERRRDRLQRGERQVGQPIEHVAGGRLVNGELARQVADLDAGLLGDGDQGPHLGAVEAGGLLDVVIVPLQVGHHDAELRQHRQHLAVLRRFRRAHRVLGAVFGVRGLLRQTGNEARPRTNKTGIGEVEDRPQIAKSVLNRCPGERNFGLR